MWPMRCGVIGYSWIPTSEPCLQRHKREHALHFLSVIRLRQVQEWIWVIMGYWVEDGFSFGVSIVRSNSRHSKAELSSRWR